MLAFIVFRLSEHISRQRRLTCVNRYVHSAILACHGIKDAFTVHYIDIFSYVQSSREQGGYYLIVELGINQ